METSDQKEKSVNIPKQKVNYYRPKDYFRPQSTICNVKYKDQSSIRGAIYGYEFPEGTWRTLFITLNQVLLGISEVKEVVGLRLSFTDMQYVDITPDWVKWLWTSPPDQLNVSVVEFSPTALTVLSRMQYARLIAAIPEKDSKVNLYHHNGEVSSGSIINIIGDLIEYKIETEISLLGSPLLNENRDVVGIHAGFWDGYGANESVQTTFSCKAITVQSILTAFMNYVLKMSNGKTDNELWLKRINLIPANEFHLIGGGGYGQVYKIKMQTELTELAVKIVQGVGTLSDYEAQVRALEKEYAIVTSLDSHPRIIQFFCLVRDDKNHRIMIVMEYLEGGSLADRFKDKIPLFNYEAHKYLVQILEGVDFLHQRLIYHNNIKPANILFSKKDDVKICDFGISGSIEWQAKSSAIASHIKGDCHYMSPERLNNASRSAANDIWSIGATFVQMISGQQINYQDTFPQIVLNVMQLKIFINGMPYNEFLQTLSDDDYKTKIISRTLCTESNRANCQQLLSILLPKLVHRLPKQTLIRAGEDLNSGIFGISYNSARDELFFVDFTNKVVRATHVRDDGGDLRDVYKAPHDTSPILLSVCHMSDSDTLLVCSRENGPDQTEAKWLVALSRNGSEWREAQRVQTEGNGLLSCALSDSRALIGCGGDYINSPYMELFRVESGSRISRVHCVHVPEMYEWFSATSCCTDTLVAMTYPIPDESVRVHRLCGDRLEELARIELLRPYYLLWLADRLLVVHWEEDKQWHAVIELGMSGTRLERRRELIAASENISVHRWCAVDDGLAIFDWNSKDILHYSFA